MTNHSRDYDKELKRVEDAFVQDILARSDSEIIAEMAEDGNASTALACARDLLRRALDASGRPIPEAKIVFRTVGPAQVAIGEDGWARAGSVGDVAMLATAIVPGTKPYIERLSLRVVPGPARRVEIDPVPARLVPRQRIQLAGGWMQAAYFIIAIRSLGLAAGPMGGFDTVSLDADLFRDSDWRSLLVVNIGYPGDKPWMERLPRLDYDEAVRHL